MQRVQHGYWDLHRISMVLTGCRPCCSLAPRDTFTSTMKGYCMRSVVHGVMAVGEGNYVGAKEWGGQGVGLVNIPWGQELRFTWLAPG